jgi:branched-chain amino acid transport system substrate-binding protein
MVVVCLASFVLVASIFTVSANRVLAENTLKIGAIWGLSGPGSNVMVVKKDGALLAADWINSKGGVTVGGKKYMIEVLVEDNRNTSEGCVSAATKLVHGQKVKFVTGMVVPFQYEAVQTVTEPNKVLLVIAKAAYLTPKTPYSFSCSHSLMAPYPGVYGFLREAYPSVKTIGFTVNDEPGSQAITAFGRDIAKAHGLELLSSVVHPFAAKDFYPVWTKVLREKPDAVDVGINLPDSLAANIRQGRELGFKGPIISCAPCDPNTVLNMIGKDLATDFIFAGFDPHSPEAPPMLKEIMKIWADKYKKPFDLDMHEGWSSIWTLVQAIEKAQSIDPTAVMKTWEKMDTVQTPWGTGRMGGAKTFGVNHMVIDLSPITRLQNGKVEFVRWYKVELP